MRSNTVNPPINSSTLSSGTGDLFSIPPDELSAAQEEQLRQALKRCSPATFEAACQFRRTGRIAYLSPIVTGVIARFVENVHRPKVETGNDELRLIEDLAVDSLTMMEMVMLTEEVLQITIDNEDLRRLRTVGDVKNFVAFKVRSLPTRNTGDAAG
jgi:acyl carrier protein